MDIRSKILSLGLPVGGYIVVGSGILHALGIRKSSDIDMVVTPEVFTNFEQQGWQHGNWEGHPTLQHDVFDIGTSWGGKNVYELLKNVTYIDEIPYLSLTAVRAWKQKARRPKDVRDVELIDSYVKEHTKAQ